MSLQVEKLEKNMAKLTIEVSAEDLEKAMQAAYQKAKGRITLPGFRKGKGRLLSYLFPVFKVIYHDIATKLV